MAGLALGDTLMLAAVGDAAVWADAWALADVAAASAASPVVAASNSFMVVGLLIAPGKCPGRKKSLRLKLRFWGMFKTLSAAA